MTKVITLLLDMINQTLQRSCSDLKEKVVQRIYNHSGVEVTINLCKDCKENPYFKQDIISEKKIEH